jgi:ubiquinone/menaquinone biosynthesis C-methylase UbiE
MIRKATERTVNYDDVSHTYDERYRTAYKPDGIASALSELAREVKAERILEIGCGTGHWLGILQALAPEVYGMDCSHGMLQKALERKGEFHLIRGDVNKFPFHDEIFDLIFCVNALHHFCDPSGLIRDVRRLLRTGGALSIIGMDPHAGRDRWFLYDYFPGVYETDINRYPSTGTIADWMIGAGFGNVTCRVGERIKLTRLGREILPLDKNFTSQLTLLTPRAYAKGIATIEAAIAKAEALGKEQEFITDISLFMTTGRVGEHD